MEDAKTKKLMYLQDTTDKNCTILRLACDFVLQDLALKTVQLKIKTHKPIFFQLISYLQQHIHQKDTKLDYYEFRNLVVEFTLEKSIYDVEKISTRLNDVKIRKYKK